MGKKRWVRQKDKRQNAAKKKKKDGPRTNVDRRTQLLDELWPCVRDCGQQDARDTWGSIFYEDGGIVWQTCTSVSMKPLGPSSVWCEGGIRLSRNVVTYTPDFTASPQNNAMLSSFGSAVGIFDSSVSLCLPASQHVLFVCTAPLCILLLQSMSYSPDTKRAREGSYNKYGLPLNNAHRVP